VAFLQSSDIVDCLIGSGFDAVVIAVDRLVSTDRCIFEAVDVLLGGENLDILAQWALIAFEGEDVISPLFQDFLGNVALTSFGISTLTAHRVDSHDGASIAIMSSNFGIATISLDFSATLTCPSTRRWRAAKAETM
jgi:hypothetical protein